MSSGLGADETPLLLSELANITNFRVLPQLAETMVFGVYTVLICVSTCVIISRGLRPWPNRIMLSTTLVMYIITAANWAIDVRLLLNELKVYLPLLITSGADADASSLINLNIVFVFVGSSIADIVIFLGDAIVLWRAYESQLLELALL
ncbi:hypothetical protein OF83DRAFT_1180007 [Amylostereum chailletii]|nr:hypothetical protein OF83DRAFT_1180007 [Amylostereum chailletii]